MNQRRHKHLRAVDDATQRTDPGFDLVDELRRAIARGPGIDYDELRADLDATIDPYPKDWYEWAAHTDRHVDLGRLEEVGSRPPSA
jgi:hypothetical protein